WRCADGSVLGCLSFTGPTCAPTPTIAEMMEYCLRHPDAQGLLAPNGTWACDGTEPVVPPGASWPVDARGFLPGAWVAILPPAATPG
ncbi:MAG TPA: hypothetical protein GYA10_05425, partial [Alphaproteobacteria bacterium]|nr:hypothetical protein [Alphaproteobacteria bacterium]